MSEFCMRTMGIYDKFTRILNENHEIHVYDEKNNVRKFVKENEFIWIENDEKRLSDCKMMNVLATAKLLKYRVEVFP